MTSPENNLNPAATIYFHDITQMLGLPTSDKAVLLGRPLDEGAQAVVYTAAIGPTTTRVDAANVAKLLSNEGYEAAVATPGYADGMPASTVILGVNRNQLVGQRAIQHMTMQGRPGLQAYMRAPGGAAFELFAQDLGAEDAARQRQARLFVAEALAFMRNHRGIDRAPGTALLVGRVRAPSTAAHIDIMHREALWQAVLDAGLESGREAQPSLVRRLMEGLIEWEAGSADAAQGYLARNGIWPYPRYRDALVEPLGDRLALRQRDQLMNRLDLAHHVGARVAAAGGAIVRAAFRPPLAVPDGPQGLLIDFAPLPATT